MRRVMDATSSRSKRWALVWPLCLVSLANAQACIKTVTCTDIAAVSTAFLGCPTITGDVTISGITWTTSGTAKPTVTVDNLLEVRGNLEFVDIAVINENIISEPGSGSFGMSVPSVQSVFGGLTFKDVNGVDIQPMDALTSVEGTLTFSNVTFGAGFTEIGPQFSSLSIIGSLYVSDTNAGSVAFEKSLAPASYFNGSASLVFMNNDQLSRIAISGYQNTEVAIHIQENNPKLRVSLPNISKGSILLQGVEHFDADGLMYLVPGSWNETQTDQIISDNTFGTLTLPNLYQIQNTTLLIDRNMNLATLQLQSLHYAYDLEITDNSVLHSIDLPSLTSVGVLQMSGPIDRISLPLLTDSAQVRQISLTPAEQSACPSLNIPSNQYHCSATATATHSPTSLATPPPKSGVGSTGGSSGGGLSSGAKIGIGVGVGVGVLAIAALIFFFWCCARRSKKRSPRSAAAGQYYMPEAKGAESSATRYTKVPAVSGSTEERSSVEEVTPSSRLGDNWYPPEQHVPTTDGRVELEEQQRPRHEMDARSLQDIDLDDDREETRSLEDIERAHLH